MPFLWTEQRCWTFGEAGTEVERVATYLEGQGICRGEIVAIAAENRPEVIFCHLALQRLGAITMPVLASATPDEMRFQLEHSEVRFVIVDPSARPAISAAVSTTARAVTILAIEGSHRNSASSALTTFPHLAGYDDLAPSALLYTSGSSGRPKGVLLPAGAPSSVARGLVSRIGVTAQDTIFLPTPLSHAVGLVTVIGTAVHCGCRLALVDRFSPSRFWKQVTDSGATVTCLFPTHLNFLLSTPTPQQAHPLRAVFTHAFNQAFVDRFGVDLHMCWGMTETGALMTMSGPLRLCPPAGYIGEPMPHVQVACFSTTDERLEVNMEGELRLTHRHVMLEYYNDPEATRATRVSGWIRSGDLGRVDPTGRVYFIGRLKNVIKRSGENISAEEIESVLLEMPEIDECLVFGIPDALRSEEVVAILHAREPGQLDPQAVLRWATQRLSRHKLPRYFLTSPTPLLKLDNGKIDRRRVVATFDVQQAWDRDEHARSTPFEAKP
jgi:crotonobetaine/carnitine-CoA ligase